MVVYDDSHPGDVLCIPLRVYMQYARRSPGIMYSAVQSATKAECARETARDTDAWAYAEVGAGSPSEGAPGAAHVEQRAQVQERRGLARAGADTLV